MRIKRKYYAIVHFWMRDSNQKHIEKFEVKEKDLIKIREEIINWMKKVSKTKAIDGYIEFRVIEEGTNKTIYEEKNVKKNTSQN